MKILFLGHQKWACLTLERLVKDGHEIVGVVTEKDSFDDASYKSLAKYDCYASLKETAVKLGLKVFQPDNIHDESFLQIMNDLNPDLLVVVSYHTIIKEPILSKYTIINAHGAPLPKYRGRAPINWAIINGEDYTGVTVHFIDPGIDTGDIILQEKVPIKDDDTTIDVLKKSLDYYPRMVSEAVKQVNDGTVKRIKQDNSKASYFPKRKPEDGLIDWFQTTDQIYNFIRALTKPYPGAFTFLNGKKVLIWNSSKPDVKIKSDSNPGTVLYSSPKLQIATKDSFIIIEEFEIEENVSILEGDLLGNEIRNKE